VAGRAGGKPSKSVVIANCGQVKADAKAKAPPAGPPSTPAPPPSSQRVGSGDRRVVHDGKAHVDFSRLTAAVLHGPLRGRRSQAVHRERPIGEGHALDHILAIAPLHLQLHVEVGAETQETSLLGLQTTDGSLACETSTFEESDRAAGQGLRRRVDQAQGSARRAVRVGQPRHALGFDLRCNEGHEGRAVRTQIEPLREGVRVASTV